MTSAPGMADVWHAMPRRPCMQTFAIMSGVYAAVGCFMQRLRQKNDGTRLLFHMLMRHIALPGMAQLWHGVSTDVRHAATTALPCDTAEIWRPSTLQHLLLFAMCSLEWCGLWLCHWPGAGVEAGTHECAAGA